MKKASIGNFEFRDDRDPEMYEIASWIKRTGMSERDAIRGAFIPRYSIETFLDTGASADEVLKKIALVRLNTARFLGELDRVEFMLSGKVPSLQPAIAMPPSPPKVFVSNGSMPPKPEGEDKFECAEVEDNF
jgi:hypothetical protein